MISLYSRADQIEDGQLINVSRLAKGKGFVDQVCITIAVHLKAIEDPDPSAQLDRLLSLLRHAYTAYSRVQWGRAEFLFSGHRLILVVEHNNSKPVISIILKGEDE